MARLFLTNIDLNKNQVLNHVLHLLGSAPGSPTEGQLYHNTTDHTVEFYNGTDFISLGRLNQIEAPNGSVDLNSQKIINLATPTGDNDAARKVDVDNARLGLDAKQSVRAATTVAGTLATSFENGDTVDGVVLATGDRILIKDQAAGADNGIYVVAASGAPARAADADTAADLSTGSFVFVEEGTTNGDTGWLLTTNAPITLGTTALVFAQFSGGGAITAGAGLTKTGNTIDVISGHAFIVVNADNIDIGTLPVNKGGTGATDAAAARTNLAATTKFTQTIGDNSATSFNVDHNFNTIDVIVQVYNASTGAQVEPDITRNTANRVIIAFATAPASNAYKVVVIG